MKILILWPHLDAGFKKEGININRVPNENNLTYPRLYYKHMLNNLLDFIEHGTVLHMPMCHITTKRVNDFLADNPHDVVFSVHKQHFELDISRTICLKDISLPGWFSFNEKGWGPTMSVYPFDVANGDPNSGAFELFLTNIINNKSKFEQPPVAGHIPLPDDFILWPCQIPGDQTLKWHAKLDTFDVLRDLAAWCHKNEKHLVVKLHPAAVNKPAKNEGYVNICKEINSPYVHWVDGYSIHDLLKKCSSVYLMNSGTGFEALLHGKPVACFGAAEYDCVSTIGIDRDLSDVYDSLEYDETKVKQFFDVFIQNCINSQDIDTYQRMLPLMEKLANGNGPGR